jgi:hypothetical protein
MGPPFRRVKSPVFTPELALARIFAGPPCIVVGDGASGIYRDGRECVPLVCSGMDGGGARAINGGLSKRYAGGVRGAPDTTTPRAGDRCAAPCGDDTPARWTVDGSAGGPPCARATRTGSARRDEPERGAPSGRPTGSAAEVG